MRKNLMNIVQLKAAPAILRAEATRLMQTEALKLSGDALNSLLMRVIGLRHEAHDAQQAFIRRAEHLRWTCGGWRNPVF